MQPNAAVGGASGVSTSFAPQSDDCYGGRRRGLCNCAWFSRGVRHTVVTESRPSSAADVVGAVIVSDERNPVGQFIHHADAYVAAIISPDHGVDGGTVCERGYHTDVCHTDICHTDIISFDIISFDRETVGALVGAVDVLGAGIAAPEFRYAGAAACRCAAQSATAPRCAARFGLVTG